MLTNGLGPPAATRDENPQRKQLKKVHPEDVTEIQKGPNASSDLEVFKNGSHRGCLAQRRSERYDAHPGSSPRKTMKAITGCDREI